MFVGDPIHRVFLRRTGFGAAKDRISAVAANSRDSLQAANHVPVVGRVATNARDSAAFR